MRPGTWAVILWCVPVRWPAKWPAKWPANFRVWPAWPATWPANFRVWPAKWPTNLFGRGQPSVNLELDVNSLHKFSGPLSGPSQNLVVRPQILVVRPLSGPLAVSLFGP